MENRSKKNPLKNISFLKLAGVNKFIMLDVYNTYLKILYIQLKEPFYKPVKNSPLTEYDIIAYEREIYDGKPENIENVLQKFIKEHEVENSYLVIGINERPTR